MSDFSHDIDGPHGRQDGPSRRRLLECMTWAGTGVLWTISGGVPHSLGLVGQAMAQDAGGLSFLQISDSHIGFDKPVNPNARGTLEEAIARIQAMPVKPSFLLHTGDITHLSKVTEFDDAEHIISQAGLDVHYVPGEHDILDPEVAKPLTGFGAGVMELALKHRGDAFRMVYALQIDDDIWVLHAFQKKSKTGIKTPKAEIDLIHERLKRLKERLK